jgi:cytochrome c-type biogenesis protein CcmH
MIRGETTQRAWWLPTAWVAVALLLLACIPVRATDADEMLKDPALEARARAITAGLRCVVCQNQSVDDSNAPLARDLRRLVRERLTAGDSDEQVIAYVVSRYGEFALLKPRFAAHTLALWLAPLVVLFAILAYALLRLRQRRDEALADATGAPLSAEQEARLRELVSEASQTEPDAASTQSSRNEG